MSARKKVESGRRVHFEYSGSNPNSASVALKVAGLDNSTDTVASSEALIVLDVEVIAETGGTVTLSGGNAGYSLLGGKLPTSGGGIAQSGVQRRCKPGSGLTVTATAGGVVTVRGTGSIIPV